jgi:hypothetical protein
MKQRLFQSRISLLLPINGSTCHNRKKGMDSEWDTNKCVFAVAMTVFVINTIWNNGN